MIHILFSWVGLSYVSFWVDPIKSLVTKYINIMHSYIMEEPV